MPGEVVNLLDWAERHQRFEPDPIDPSRVGRCPQCGGVFEVRLTGLYECPHCLEVVQPALGKPW